MGNRPINRRPFRRPPWRKRREARWIDANSVPVTPEFPCTTGSGVVICDGGPGAPQRSTVRELISGEIDLEWSDSNEVLHERIVGSIALATSTLQPYNIPDDPLSVARPLVRLGLLTVEDAAPDAGGLTDLTQISLWDNDHLQRYEWMWLYQTYGDAHHLVDDDRHLSLSQTDIPVDVRSKRKLGRTDRVVLLASFAVTTNGAFYTHSASIWPLLRTVVTTK